MSERNKVKRKKLKTPVKRRSVLGRVITMLLMFLVALVGFYVVTFDVNDYRDELSKVMSQKLGRSVSLKGKLALGLSRRDGLLLEAKDVHIGNPSWTRRRDMVQVGLFRFRLALPPLLKRQINVTALIIEEPKVYLETSKKGLNNWTFVSKPQASKTKLSKKKPKEPKAEPTQKVALHIKSVRILNSEIELRGPAGKVTHIKVPKLTLLQKKASSHFRLTSFFNGMKADIELAGLPFEMLGKKDWPFNMEGSIGYHDIKASGAIGAKAKRVLLKTLSLHKGDYKLTGRMLVAFGSSPLKISGKLRSKELDESFFALTAAALPEQKAPPAQSAKTKTKERFFSRHVMDFSSLKKANVNLDIKVGRWHVGPSFLDDVDLNLELHNGKLNAPFLARIGGRKAMGGLTLDASRTSAKLGLTLKAQKIDLTKLLSYEGVDRVLSGKADIDIHLRSVGRTSYGFASNANGRVDFLMDTGVSSSSALSGFAGQALGYFMPGISTFLETGLNCVAAHYVVKNGLLETKGFLADTKMTVIAGTGLVNLPDETINLYFRTKPKGLGSMIPPMHISGTFMDPKYTVQGKGVLTKMFGMVTGDNQHVAGVPNVVPVNGKNACEVALTAPVSATGSRGSNLNMLLPHVGPEIGNKIKDIGGKLFQQLGNSGLFAK